LTALQPIADLRTAAEVLAGHPDEGCRRLAARLQRVLAGADSKEALGLYYDGRASLIEVERDMRRNGELRRWVDRRFRGCSRRGAANAMASLWRNYRRGELWPADADLQAVPSVYRGTHREHLFILGKMGCEPISAAAIRTIISGLSGLERLVSNSHQRCDSASQEEREHTDEADVHAV
jgi:hypothetical protein